MLEKTRKELDLDIKFVGIDRERGTKMLSASLTCNFTICEGSTNTHAEVIFADGGFEIIEKQGKSGKAAARMALERLLNCGCNPFEIPLFVRISLPHAQYFALHGDFHRTLKT